MCIVAVAERSLKRLPAGRFQYIRVYRCYSQRSLNHLLAGISSIYYSHRLISKKTSAARGRGGPPSHDLSRANNMSLGFTSPVLGHPDLKTCSPPLAPWHGASSPPLAPWHGASSPPLAPWHGTNSPPLAPWHGTSSPPLAPRHGTNSPPLAPWRGTNSPL